MEESSVTTSGGGHISGSHDSKTSKMADISSSVCSTLAGPSVRRPPPPRADVLDDPRTVRRFLFSVSVTTASSLRASKVFHTNIAEPDDR